MSIRVIRAAGGILWRTGRGSARIALVHRPRKDDWTLPKGKLEPGESWQAAALREVHEETGCVARLTTFAGAACYETRRGLKLVLYWNMDLVRQGPLERLHEVDEILWTDPAEALETLDRAHERRLVERARTRAVASVTPAALIACAEAAMTRGELDRARRLVNASQSPLAPYRLRDARP